MKKVLLLMLLICCPSIVSAAPVLSKIQEVSPSFLTEMNGAFYFSAYDSVNGSTLWRSDGTSGGTTIIKTFATGTSRELPRGLYNAGGTLYFCAFEEASGWELWKSDGTEAGTTMIEYFDPGPSDGVSEVYCHLAHIGTTLFFPGVTGASTNWALMKTDGTVANTELVRDNNPVPNTGLPKYLFVMNDTLFFVEGDGTHGDEFWKCEGPDYDSDSTSMVKDIWPLPNFGGVSMDSSRQPVIQDGYFYFQGNDGVNGYEFWRSDGTEAGTTMVKNINETPYVIATGAGSSSPSSFTAVNGTIYFRAYDDTNGMELWKSDGTDAGTMLVKDINPAGNGNPDSLAAANGMLFFAANDGTHGEEPWISDGTESGTVMLSDINAAGDSSTRSFTGLANMVYFRADDGINGTELWQTDGTVGNAAQVADIGPGSESSWPGNFLVFGKGLYFRATYDNGVPEGDGDALYRYGYPAGGLYWPMFQPAIYNDKMVR